MTLGDLKKKLAMAIFHGDTETVRRICDRLRHRGWGPIAPFSYADLRAFAQDAVPALTPQQWEGLMYEVDNDEESE